MLAGLLAPLRLPEALDGLVESTRELGPIRSELTRVRELAEPPAELGAALERMNENLGTRLDGVRAVVVELESERSHLNRTAAETLSGVKDDIQRTTGLRGERGMAERARDALTGSKED